MILCTKVTNGISTNQFFVEGENVIYIDGMAYDKSTLTPIPFNTRNITAAQTGTDRSTSLKMHKGRDYTKSGTMLATESWGDIAHSRITRGQTALVKSCTIYNTTENAEMIMPGLGGTAWLLNNMGVDLTPAIYPAECAIVDEIGNAIFGMFKMGYHGTTPWYGYLKKIDKATLTEASVSSFDCCLHPIFLGKDENFLWYAMNAQTAGGAGQIIFFCYNKFSNTVTQVLLHNPNVRTFTQIPSQAVTLANGNLFTYAFLADSATAPWIRMYGIEIPKQGSVTGTKTLCTVDWGANDPAVLFPLSSAVSNQRNMSETWVVSTTNNKYVCSAMVQSSDSAQSWSNLATMKVYIWQVANMSTTPNTLVYKGFVDISSLAGESLRHVMPYDDKWNTVYFIFDTKIIPANFDEATNTYITQPAINIACKSFGIDSLDRLWAIDATNNLHVLSPTLAATVSVSFAATSYDYTGTTINTSINVSARDYTNARIVSSVRVTIDSSNATFSDDTTSKLITTSATADVNVGIKIIAAGQVKLHSNLEV